MRRKAMVKGSAFIVGVLLCILGMLFLYSKFLEAELSKNTTRTLKEISQQSATIINNEVKSELDLLGEIAKKVSRDEREFEIERVMTELEKTAKTHEFKIMGLILNTGEVYNTEGLQLDVPDIITKYSSVFQGESIVTDRMTDRMDGEHIVLYGVPVYVEHEVVAVLFAAYSIADFKELLSIETFEGNGYSYVMKQNGDKIVDSIHPNSFRNFTNIFEVIISADGGNAPACEELRAGMQENKSGHILFFNKELKYMQYTPLEVNDWYLLSVVPTHVIDESAELIMERTFIVCSTAVMVVILTIAYFFNIKQKDKEKYDNLLYVDSITGGASYTKFVLDAGGSLASNKKNVAFLAIELVNMNVLFEKYGNDKCNEILRFVHHTIKEVTHQDSISARVTSNEFVLLEHFDSKEDMVGRIQEFREAVTIPPEEIVCGVILQPVIGIYLVDGSTKDIIRMQNFAMMAKTSLEEGHGEFYAFYDDLYKDTLLRNKQLEDEMVIGRQNDEFVPYFQPKYDTVTRQMVGAEALVRWIKADGTVVSPGEFIPYAEHSGFVVQIDKMMFKKVCMKQRELMDLGIKPVPISVNLSRKVLYDAGFIDEFLSIMQEYNIPQELVELELTESTVFSNEDEFRNITMEIRKRGFKILVDDFGIGYSSLMMLKSVLVDAIKLDKSFIDDYRDCKGSEVIISIISLTKKLQIPIIVEGVETQDQYEFLLGMNCDTIQGYYFARPMQFEEFQKSLI